MEGLFASHERLNCPNGGPQTPVTGKLPQRGLREGGLLKLQSRGLQPCLPEEMSKDQSLTSVPFRFTD